MRASGIGLAGAHWLGGKGDIADGAGGLGDLLARYAAGQTGCAAGLDAKAKAFGHADWIFGKRDRRIYEHSVGTDLQRERRIRGRTESGINDDRNVGVLDDYLYLLDVKMPRPEPIGEPSGITVAHPVSFMPGQDRIGVNIGQYDEAIVDFST